MMDFSGTDSYMWLIFRLFLIMHSLIEEQIHINVRCSATQSFKHLKKIPKICKLIYNPVKVESETIIFYSKPDSESFTDVTFKQNLVKTSYIDLIGLT